MMDELLRTYFITHFSKFRFTKKQTECGLLVLSGRSNKQIATELNTRVPLVKQVLTAVYRKSRVKTRAEFICTCYQAVFKEQSKPVLAKGIKL